jgi:hypothetical protein
MPSVVTLVRSEHLPCPFLVPGTHQDSDAHDTRETALVFPVQFALNALAFKHVFEDLRFGKVVRCVDYHWFVCFTGKTPLCNKRIGASVLAAIK